MADMSVCDFLEGWKLIVKRIENEVDADLILQQVVFGFWRLWKCRNDLVFEGKSTLPLMVVELWQQQVAEFRTALEGDDGQGRDLRARDGVGCGVLLGRGKGEGVGVNGEGEERLQVLSGRSRPLGI